MKFKLKLHWHSKKIYYILMILSGFISLGKILLYARMLSPEGLGQYSIFLLLSNYGIYICSCGAYEGSMGTFPGWYGEGRSKDITIYRNKVIGFTLISSLLLFLVCAIFVSLSSWKYEDNLNTIYLAFLFSGVSSLFLILLADIRSRLQILEFGIIMFFRSILSLIFGSLSAHYFGYSGILFSEIIITFLLGFFIVKYFIKDFSLDFSNLRVLRPVFRVGFPLVLNGLITTAASNIDRFFVMKTWNSTIFGYYSFAMIVITGGSLIQSILYQQIGPEILHKIGQGISPQKLLNKLNIYLSMFFLFLIVAWYPFNVLIKYIVSNYFIEYYQAYPIISILYLGASLIVISLYENFTIAAGKSEYLLFVNIFVVCVTATLLSICMTLNLSTIAFAVVYVIGRFLYFAATFALAQWFSKKLSFVQL